MTLNKEEKVSCIEENYGDLLAQYKEIPFQSKHTNLEHNSANKNIKQVDRVEGTMQEVQHQAC